MIAIPYSTQWLVGLVRYQATKPQTSQKNSKVFGLFGDQPNHQTNQTNHKHHQAPQTSEGFWFVWWFPSDVATDGFGLVLRILKKMKSNWYYAGWKGILKFQASQKFKDFILYLLMYGCLGAMVPMAIGHLSYMSDRDLLANPNRATLEKLCLCFIFTIHKQKRSKSFSKNKDTLMKQETWWFWGSMWLEHQDLSINLYAVYPTICKPQSHILFADASWISKSIVTVFVCLRKIYLTWM